MTSSFKGIESLFLSPYNNLSPNSFMRHTWVKIKQLACCYVYSKGIDTDIEKFVKSCIECALKKINPPKVLFHPWDTPANNWERIHINYTGPNQNCYFLVVLDAKYKWNEVTVSPQTPTTQSTFQLLDDNLPFVVFPCPLCQIMPLFSSPMYSNNTVCVTIFDKN